MPKKYVYDSETLQILESLWAQGMQNCSTDENKLKIQQASTATGLVDERIKLWIYCRNRKKRRDVEGKSKKAKSSSTTAATIPSDDVTRNNLKEINQTVVEEIDSGCNRHEQEERGHQSPSSSPDEEVNRSIAHLPIQHSGGQQGRAAHLKKSRE